MKGLLLLLISTVVCQNIGKIEKMPAPDNGSDMEFYQEDPWTGINSYYSSTYYTWYDPQTLNFKSSYYDKTFGTNYFWKDYTDGKYTESLYNAKDKETKYYTTNDTGAL
jgi:hypothetical protein